MINFIIYNDRLRKAYSFFYFIAVIALIVGLIISPFFISFYMKEKAYFKSFIPKKIELGWYYSSGRDFGFFHDNCGAAVFSISDNTVLKIKQNGLRYLNSNSKKELIWIDIIPEGADGWTYGLTCAKEANSDFPETQIRKAFSEANVFYQQQNQSGIKLVIFPSKGLIVVMIGP